MGTLISQFRSLFKDMYRELFECLSETKEQRAEKIAKEDLSYIFQRVIYPVSLEDIEHFQKLSLDQMDFIIDHLKRGYSLEYMKNHSVWNIDQ